MITCQPNPMQQRITRMKCFAIWYSVMWLTAAVICGPSAALGYCCPQADEASTAAVLPDEVEGYESRILNDWPIRVSRFLLREKPKEIETTLDLLRLQIDQIYTVVPPDAIARLGKVTIWLSPPYDGFRPTGEYHPGKGWLERNGRSPKLHQCIEFTNTALFAKEVRRMPSLLLHEFAHAYHDQVLGYDNADVAAAYESARAAGLYESVLR
ncbi:MAG: hypothetical protein AAGG44_19695, partial [Planctomycetota bacterium]